MRLFECEACGQFLGFEDTRCLRCGHALGFLPERMDLVALDPAGQRRWTPLVQDGHVYQYCANDRHQACNWLVSSDSGYAYCPACRLNRTIPDLSQPRHIVYWRSLERAKHRLVYGLMRLRLPLTAKVDQPEVGLAFDFLASVEDGGGAEPVLTGHARGLITINVQEADDVERETFRANLAEPYRTLLGHFRHEVGHYYWERLVEGTAWIDSFREIFGDERADYAAHLESYYSRQDQEVTWPTLHISQYAAAHPWEDWAETWGHYLHLLDTLETAYWYGVGIAPKAGSDPTLTTMADFDPYEDVPFDELQRAWFPVVYLGNSLNRSMGQPDLYPFVLSPRVLEKLRFVHGVARQANLLTGAVDGGGYAGD